jgi:hypothetical protein
MTAHPEPSEQDLQRLRDYAGWGPIPQVEFPEGPCELPPYIGQTGREFRIYQEPPVVFVGGVVGGGGGGGGAGSEGAVAGQEDGKAEREAGTPVPSVRAGRNIPVVLGPIVTSPEGERLLVECCLREAVARSPIVMSPNDEQSARDLIARALLGDESDQDPELARYIEARERIRGKHMKELVECYSKALADAVNRAFDQGCPPTTRTGERPAGVDLRDNRWEK